jgi:hypothetical protein
LRLHPEKTRIAHLSEGAEVFTFLGFEHRMRESWRQPDRWYLQKWPSRRAMASIRGKIRARTDRRYAGLPLEWAVEDLNRVLRGWGNYFRYGNSARKFSQIDCYVNERLALLASAKTRTAGPELGHPLQPRVGGPARHPSPDRNGETDACVCQPVNDVGEPCAREPHARFDAAAGGNTGPVGNAARSLDGLPPTLQLRRLDPASASARRGTGAGASQPANRAGCPGPGPYAACQKGPPQAATGSVASGPSDAQKLLDGHKWGARWILQSYAQVGRGCRR